MEHGSFVDRVLAHLPATLPRDWEFWHWKHAGRPTDEGIGVLPVPGADPDKIIAAVMDVDRYVGNIEHVGICRSVPDPRFGEGAVRFYQKLDLPMLGSVHHELVLHDLGVKGPWRVAAWSVLRAETDALSPKVGFRSDYNHGAWLVAPGLIGYGLGSAPKREDVGMFKWTALTTGADLAASRVVKTNIEGMARWAARRG